MHLFNHCYQIFSDKITLFSTYGKKVSALYDKFLLTVMHKLILHITHGFLGKLDLHDVLVTTTRQFIQKYFHFLGICSLVMFLAVTHYNGLILNEFLNNIAHVLLCNFIEIFSNFGWNHNLFL